jgi:hypothetical protein
LPTTAAPAAPPADRDAARQSAFSSASCCTLQVARQSTPGLAQVVDHVRQLLVIELVGKARHRLHALKAGELLFTDTFDDDLDQVARVGLAQLVLPCMATAMCGLPSPSTP